MAVTLSHQQREEAPIKAAVSARPAEPHRTRRGRKRKEMSRAISQCNYLEGNELCIWQVPVNAPGVASALEGGRPALCAPVKARI